MRWSTFAIVLVGCLAAALPAPQVSAAGPIVVIKKVDETTTTGTLESVQDGSLVLIVKKEKPKPAEKGKPDTNAKPEKGKAENAKSTETVEQKIHVPLDELVELTPKDKPATVSATPAAPSTGKSGDKDKPKGATSAPAATAVVCDITFSTNDRLHGGLAAWSEKHLSLRTPLATGGTLEVPMEQLRTVWMGTDEQVKQAKAIPLEPGPEDTAFVVKENAVVSVRGVVLGIDGESLRFKFNDQERKIGLAKLVGVILGGQEAKHDDTFRQSIQLNNGDAVSGTWRTFSKNNVGLETPWGASLQVPFAKVFSIHGLNGRLLYLSDLKPARVEQVPYFDRLIPWKADLSLTGGPLKLIDGDYIKGLAVHARCVLEYEIGGKYETFAAKVGFQQPEGRLGQAVVRVIGDGRTLYEDLDARGDAAKPAEVNVKVGGVTRLVLEVDFGKNEDTGDRVVWANARLLRAAH